MGRQRWGSDTTQVAFTVTGTRWRAQKKSEKPWGRGGGFPLPFEPRIPCHAMPHPTPPSPAAQGHEATLSFVLFRFSATPRNGTLPLLQLLSYVSSPLIIPPLCCGIQRARPLDDTMFWNAVALAWRNWGGR